jgi:hypothetical protein
VYKTDGKRLVINLDRVIKFEEINAETIKVTLEDRSEYDLKLTFDALTKAMEE